MITHLRKTLVAGVVVLVPLVVTIKVLEILFKFADGILGNTLSKLLHRQIPGLGLLLFVVLIYLAGLATRTFLGKGFLKWAEQVIGKIPIARTIHAGVKQLLGPFSEEGAKAFGQAVLVEYPSPGVYTYGFLVKDKIFMDGKPEMANVFIASNHLHVGFIIMAKRADLIELDMPFEGIIKLMASFGSASPKFRSAGSARPKE